MSLSPAEPPSGAARLGEGCWLFPFASEGSVEASRRVLQAQARLTEERDAGRLPVLDVVPGLTSLGVHFDPVEDAQRVLAAVEDLLASASGDPGDLGHGRVHTLPTRFDGPDLATVSANAGLSEAEAILAFRDPAYVVAAVGFLPHFPYLLGLDPRLATPRRSSPRTRVPAGSVAIGNDQAGVYPQESPGGWNLVGSTDPQRLRAIRPGDTVRFEALR